MAADVETPASCQTIRKRKREKDHPKLLIDGKVEVRSFEEGFQGSWHTATVIDCKNLVRHVQYDHLLCDDGSEKLTEYVKVSPMLDGAFTANGTLPYCRGFIRPLAPPLDLGKWCPHYGQCVDMFHQEAWWEGVIFDHADGSEERKIFFPDMGDELNAQIEMLRITQDWDEGTGEWKPRGNWLFLELIEELEQEWPLLVSVKQIWYEVQVKNGFQNLKEWTCSGRDTWRDLVLQVIMDNFKLTCKEFFHQLKSSVGLGQESQLLLELPYSTLDSILNPEAYFGNALGVVPFETTSQLDRDCMQPNDLKDTSLQPVEKEINRDLAYAMEDDRWDRNLPISSIVPSPEEALCAPPSALLISPTNSDEYLRILSSGNSEAFSCMSSKDPSGKIKHSTKRNRIKWLPASRDMLPEAEFCPDAIGEYINDSSFKKKASTSNARKHLLYLGWKIEYARDISITRNLTRLRYVTPDGKKSYQSLRQACQSLIEHGSALIPQDDERNLVAAPDGPYPSSHTEQPQVCKEAPEAPSHSYDVGNPEYCPQAVVDYYLLGLQDQDAYRSGKRDAKLRDMSLKAMKHLSAVGWSFHYGWRRGKRELRYSSPSGRIIHSLRTACKFHINKRGLSNSNACTPERRQNIIFSKEAKGQLAIDGSCPPPIEIQGSLISWDAVPEKQQTKSANISVSRELVELGKATRDGVHAASWSYTTNTQIGCSALPRTVAESNTLIKLRKNMDVDFSTRVLRSSKIARKVVPSSSHHTPRTVLSWLIDNNVVLPEAKVYYRGRKGGHPMAEGLITRDGIKCNCCQVVFTLSNFEAHAGSTNRRPSANIFLEDGRSLLDCQVQLKCNNSMRRGRTRPREMKGNQHHSTNDNICSVCHYGGELVLCDQCPSSFHLSCLGLKDVPVGDWFCPSCCCGICGQSRFTKDIGQFTDNSALNCDQCEHQYHIGCLRTKGLANLDCFPKENWFCNERCEQIFLGLHRLLGKPVALGLENLTWTLMKDWRSDCCDYDASDIEASMENYSKLNVALGVMHECFEPLKEPRTRRDLVEDVIFSRWSELNRLNFRGFYTVILEKNDELITVATVRVYGEKVAEVPLIGTRFQYRRLGMCRILMNELEKNGSRSPLKFLYWKTPIISTPGLSSVFQPHLTCGALMDVCLWELCVIPKLKELGVGTLVLPAVPSVLNTWTTSFGYSIMTESERLNFLDYPFLDFQGTVMCQKLLMEIPSRELSLLKGTKPKLCDAISENNIVGLDGNSAVSEGFQADPIEESQILEKGRMDIAGGKGNDRGNGTAPLVIMANQATPVECMPCPSEVSVGCSVEAVDQKEGEHIGNGMFKCYICL
ncbi:unnamed protein product [Ilex paraguariensis]|uniref:PHD-type domain-containing protein n=1 Tax=Ilex paraguariensis TaxID=185542 RepID=A0ABC8T445_9AQUA